MNTSEQVTVTNVATGEPVAPIQGYARVICTNRLLLGESEPVDLRGITLPPLPPKGTLRFHKPRDRANKAQLTALLRLYQRDPGQHRTFLAFRRSATMSYPLGCMMVQWCGMWIGIEDDGYTHS